MPEALIWGASGGIGRALVRRLKEAGWLVYGAARAAERLPDDLDLGVEFEAGDPTSIERAMMRIAQETEGLDLVIYAAGGIQAAQLTDLSPQAWRDVVDSNLSGAYQTASASMNVLNEGGRMMFFGAYVDHLILPKMGAYATAKAGLEALVKVLAKENRKHTFTLIRPGAVDTPFWDQAPFRLPKDAKTPGTVADAVLAAIESDENGELNL